MNHKIFFLVTMLAVGLVACKKDNKRPPNATISGRVVYNNQAVGVRSNGVQLELWQYGYQLFSKIPVYVSQDGTFSAKVFNGNYKLTLLRGNGPWADKTDSIDVAVNGSAQIDVPVDPYFIITDESFQRSGNTITATFRVQQVKTGKALEVVRLYIGQTIILDQNNNVFNAQKAAAAIDLSQPITVTGTIPASLASKNYVFVRAGVKAVGVGELLYTKPQEIAIK